jgi:sugar transferase (PEP-CTERM/EpsH1 system associated)
MKILFVSARLPYPSLYGDQVRAFNQLKILGRRHDITLLSFVHGRVSPEAHAALAPFCRKILAVPHHWRHKAIGCLRGAFSRYPIQTLFHQSGAMARAVRQHLSSGAFDLVHVQLVRMAPYFENVTGIPRVLDLIDALSLNMDRRSRRERGPLKFAAAMERNRLMTYERAVCAAYDQTIVVSSLDRAAIGDFSNLHTIPMGMDLDKFPFHTGQRQPNSIVFSGNMGYFPNIDAAKWFVYEVLPLVKSRIPDVRLKIVGVNPHPDVRRLAEYDPAVTVTGYVEDMYAHLNQATVAVAPLRAGSGMQIKVIESMATGTPLVATSFGLGGIDVVGGRHVLIADEPDAFAAHVVRLLNDGSLRSTLASNARQLVKEKYTWERSVEMLHRVYGLALSRHVSKPADTRKAA